MTNNPEYLYLRIRKAIKEGKWIKFKNRKLKFITKKTDITERKEVAV